MKAVRLSHQVREYLRHLPPVPKQRVRDALRGLGALEGDLKELEPPLDGYTRLRIYQFRLILKIQEATVDVIFLEKRSIVYELFAAKEWEDG
jgi:mRNA-degrading endonuclease RelE of RelBE toxin-antitoxin system